MHATKVGTLSVLLMLAAVTAVSSAVTPSHAEEAASRAADVAATWRAKLKSELPRFGHRNWIVIADSAYPKQSAPGIETIYTGAGQLEVLDTVLKAIDATPHVHPIVLLDAELDSVPEKDAPGVQGYRKQLQQQLKGKQVQVLPHEQIIGKLDEASQLFNVLLLKTDMVIPYTSVFLQLECGYWDAEKEQALRDAMAAEERRTSNIEHRTSK